ncbi:uncharacterized protein LOC134280044 [Saccostrea cucullata]|uniref:uncharacterized protein LOC134280044 n=1 Tax=Saccostrea cuccullata TaxID=36930 RepID=UPI002ED4E620
MGRREKKNKELLFVHDKMYSIIPDIPTAKGIQEKEKVLSIQRPKPSPLKASGKRYEVLPRAGDIFPPSLPANTSRLHPKIDTIMSEPKTKKMKAPLACLDTERIRETIDKAKNKSRKAKKKSTEPPPKEFYQQINDSNKQHESTVPQAHIPRPPSNPNDPAKQRRIVKLRQSTSCRDLDIGQYESPMNSVILQRSVHHSEDYMVFDQGSRNVNPEQYMEYPNPAEYAVYKDPTPAIRFMNPVNYNRCTAPTEGLQYIDPHQVLDHLNPYTRRFSAPKEHDAYMNPHHVLDNLDPLPHTKRFSAPKEQDAFMNPHQVLDNLDPLPHTRRFSVPKEQDAYMDPHEVLDHLNPFPYSGECSAPNEYAAYMDQHLVLEQMNLSSYSGRSALHEYNGYGNPKQPITYMNPNKRTATFDPQIRCAIPERLYVKHDHHSASNSNCYSKPKKTYRKKASKEKSVRHSSTISIDNICI